MNQTLSHLEAMEFYDWFGAKQDLQRVYEHPAIRSLFDHADFGIANAVVEFGCGTGRVAEMVMRAVPPEATYAGFDISSTMVGLARRRLERWGERARVELSDGSPRLPMGESVCDRFLCTYVLDLLDENERRIIVREAGRILVPGGRLCLASLTHGRNWPSRMVESAWDRLYAYNPRILGGCRPISLLDLLGPDWRVMHHEVTCRLGLCTEVLVAG